MLKTNYKNKKERKKAKFVSLRCKKMKKINVLMVGPEISYNLYFKFNAF